MMRHLSTPRQTAFASGRPARLRFPKILAALTVAALSSAVMVGAHSVANAAAEGPYGGTAAAVPGTVQAENYDTGGQGVAYNVTSVNGTGNSYRSDGVDLETTTDTGGGYDLGWTAAGQWFKYTVNVATAGTYTVGLRLAAPNAVTDALHIANAAGTNLSGNVNAPATGGYQTWTTVNASVTLPAGTQTLTVDQDNAGWNINYLTFASAADGALWRYPAAVPGTVQAENYDTGGQGVAYNVTSVNGSANSYRSDGVDLEATTDTGGGYDLGWTAGRTVVQVHRQRRDRRHLHGRPASGRAQRGHRRPAHRQRLRHEPERERQRPGHRRLPGLDHGQRHRHPARRHADADRGPGQRRLEHQLPHLRQRVRRRHAPAAPAAASART